MIQNSSCKSLKNQYTSLMNKKLTREQLSTIYDILVILCGASEREREEFIYHQSQENFPTEYRFCGNLGFGGKFWRNSGRIYVTCYPEDETPERMEPILKTNKLLQAFYICATE